MIKEVSVVCKKVLIEFLTKFILDNVWKRQKSFWICRQFEQVDDNQITDSQSHLIQGARLLKEHWKIILYSKDITSKYTSNVNIVKGTTDPRHWVLRLILTQQLYFNAEASTSLVKLQLGKGQQKHRIPLPNPCKKLNKSSNFDKTMYQFREIHVLILTNPCNNLEKSMYQNTQTNHEKLTIKGGQPLQPLQSAWP